MRRSRTCNQAWAADRFRIRRERRRAIENFPEPEAMCCGFFFCSGSLKGGCATMWEMRNTLGLRAALIAVLCGCSFGAMAKDEGALPTKPAELFQTDKVWDVHLKFTPEEWAAMEPKAPGGGGYGR